MVPLTAKEVINSIACSKVAIASFTSSYQGELAAQAAELFDAFWQGDKEHLPQESKQANSVLVPNQSRSCRRWIACIYADFLGTANLDYRSLFQNYELNLVSRDPDLCRRLQAQFEADLTEASAVNATRWRQRRWVPRLAELLGWSVRRWL